MANRTIVLSPNDPNQENIAPFTNPLANVCSTAQEAYAAHMDRSAKGSDKCTHGPWSSDAEKVKLLLCFFDGTEIAFTLVDNAK